MKKYFIACVFLASFPSVAFASWWNPFSWDIFSSNSQTYTKTQITGTTSNKVSSTTVISTNHTQQEIASNTPTTSTGTIAMSGPQTNKPTKKIIQKIFQLATTSSSSVSIKNIQIVQLVATTTPIVSDLIIPESGIIKNTSLSIDQPSYNQIINMPASTTGFLAYFTVYSGTSTLYLSEYPSVSIITSTNNTDITVKNIDVGNVYLSKPGYPFTLSVPHYWTIQANSSSTFEISGMLINGGLNTATSSVSIANIYLTDDPQNMQKYSHIGITGLNSDFSNTVLLGPKNPIIY